MRRQGAAAGWGYQKNRIRKTKKERKERKAAAARR
jgi:hypothetical protein